MITIQVKLKKAKYLSVIYHAKYNHLDSVFDEVLVPILCASRAQFVMFFLFLHIFLPPLDFCQDIQM